MQDLIVNEMKVSKEINVELEIRKRIDFMKQELKDSNTTSLILGISGGQDSTLLGKLAQMAVDELGGDYKFIAVRLPYGEQFDENDCQLVLDYIKPNEHQNINIKPIVDTLCEQTHQKTNHFNKGNAKARIRMVSQYLVASNNNGLVLGTDHSAENLVGFFTKHGDGACDIAPLFGLNKRQGRMLLQYLNAPEVLYTKVPTADLEDDKEGIADEVALGVTYEQIDDYLEGRVIELKAQQRIEHLYKVSAHKRRLPKTIYDL